MQYSGFSAALAAVAATTIVTTTADAGPRHRGDGATSYITVGSRYNPSQTVSAPVRRKANGRAEVKLPRGPWVDCGASCYSTLRVWVFDFWEISERGRFP